MIGMVARAAFPFTHSRFKVSVLTASILFSFAQASQ